MSTEETQILIVEDEAIIAQDIAITLKNAGYSIAGIAHNAEKAIEILNNTPPALALLDIQINGNINGLMLASIINDQYKLPFIFLTSFTDEETLEKVKDLKAAGYIIKPFDARELAVNVELAIERYKTEKSEKTELPKTGDDYFFVKRESELIKVKSSEILFAQAFDNYCYLITSSQKYLIPHTLKSVEEKLTAHNFLRAHRSYLINLAAVQVIGEDYVEIESQRIPVSRQAKPELMQKISLL